MARMEQLEDRRMLTISTPVLGTGNEVVFHGNGDVDSITFSVGGGGFLAHNLGGRFGFNNATDLDSVTPGDQTRLLSDITSLTYDDSGENDAAVFGPSNDFDLASADLSINAGTILVKVNSSISSDDGAINLTASRNVQLDSGSSLTTVDGGISLSANASGTAAGDFNGLEADNATIESTGTGNISLTGHGGDDAGTTQHHGVDLHSGTSLSSTSTDPNAGTITINGTGGDGSGNSYGVYFSGSGSDPAFVEVTSVDGAISITGTGGNGAGSGNWGVQMSQIETISSTGTGPNAATIMIHGTGGGGPLGGLGVYLAGQATDITSVDGDIFIAGQGVANGTGSNVFGVRTWQIDRISSTGTGPDAAKITIEGTGGDGWNSNSGLSFDSTDISSVDGDILISGHGGNGGGSWNRGVDGSAAISSTGTGVDAATITIVGDGGDGGDSSYGVSLSGTLTSVDGDINITGTGGAGATTRYHTGVSSSSTISSTGTGTNAATISIHGTGGAGVFDNRGVTFGGSITSAVGAISITGHGGDGSGTGNDGALLSGTIVSNGSGDTAATITIDGAGGAGGGRGLYFLDNAGVTSVDGAISITGQGGNGAFSDNIGVHLVDVETISSTGTGPDAATITIDGTGGNGATGNDGISISGANSAIRSVDGDISIAGIGGDRSDPADRYSENRGVVLDGVTVESTGMTAEAATIAINGTGGDSGRNGYGVYVADGVLRSVVGDVNAVGNASAGSGVYLLRSDIASTGTLPLAADLTFAGNGVNIVGDVSTVDGDFSAETSGASLSGNFESMGQGSFLVGLSGNGSNTSVYGNMTSAEGDIAIRGTYVNVSGIHSTGTGSSAAAVRIGDSGTHRVSVNGEITTVDGPVIIANQVDPTATQSGFVSINGTVRSTGLGTVAGTISINGHGSGNVGGARILSNGAIESIDGDISIIGIGGSGRDGVEFAGFQHVRSTGVGTNAASISIMGTGGDGGTSVANGIDADGNNTGSISTVDGDIELHGSGGTGTSSSGLYLRELSIESTSSSSGSGNITLVGHGGPGFGSNNTGMDSQDVNIATVNGDILIEGQGGEGSGSSNRGILTTLTNVVSTGAGADAGTITLRGTGGGGTTPDGVHINASTLHSIDGDVSIQGTGGTYDGTPTSHTWRSKGVLIRGSDNSIVSTGTSPDAATITIEGTGGGNNVLNNGIELNGLNGVITSAYGEILLSGVGGNGNSRGIESFNWGEISSTGIGLDAAKITLDGTGSGNANGILLEADSASRNYTITSIDGDIELRGSSPTGAGVWAYYYSPASTDNPGSASITATGAADIRIQAIDSYLALQDPNLHLTTNAGTLELLGNSVSVYWAEVGPIAGPVSIQADDVAIAIGATIRSSGDLTIAPLTPGTSIGLGGGAGQLNINDEDLAGLADGFSSITIGDVNNGTGTVNIDTATFTDPVIIAGGVIHDNGGTDIDAGTNTVTLIGTVSPGQSPGVLAVNGDFAFADGDTFDIEIGGPAPGNTATDHDQLDVTGTVTIGANVALNTSHYGGFIPLDEQQFVIISNDDTDAVNGTFAGLAEGDMLPVDGGSFLISYAGGDGNDVVITFVDNQPPTASAGGSYSVAEGGSLQLDASASSDPDLPNDTLTFAWDLDGDGIFGETGADATRGAEVGVNPNFLAAGLDGPSSVIVQLRVTDGGGLTDFDTASIDINNVAPSVTLNSVPMIDENGTATLTGTITDPGTLDTHEVAIDWGDGVSDIVTPISESLTLTPVSDRAGEDTNFDGNFDNLESDSSSYIVEFLGDFYGDPVSEKRAALEFDLTTIPNGLSVRSATLSFSRIGGTPPGLGTMELHGYTGNGLVDLSDMTVANLVAGPFSDSEAELGSIDITSFIQSQLAAGSDFGGLLLKSTLVGRQTQLASANNPNASLRPQLTIEFVATTFSATHQYLDDGPSGTSSHVYPIEVTVTDDDGGAASSATGVTVENVPPTVAVDQTSVIIDEGAVVTNSGTFSDAGVNDTVMLSTSVGQVVDNLDGTWNWSFHTAEGPEESQTVFITATDDDGGVTTVSFDLAVNNVAPTATLSAPANAIVNQELTFAIAASDESILDQAAGFAYVVDFGDGTTAPVGRIPSNDTGVTLTHLFSTPGSFAVTLIATDIDGGASLAVTHEVVVAEITPEGLQEVVDQLDIGGEMQREVALKPVSDSELVSTIKAIEELKVKDVAPEVKVLVKLDKGSYTGIAVKVPNKTIVKLQKGKLTGASPALTVLGGIVIAEEVTFINSTAAPTILVNGGSLTVRDSTINETDGGDYAGVEIVDGMVDLGTAAEAGGNTLIVHGAGQAIRNLSTNGISALGNTFQFEGSTLTSGFQIEDVTYHALDASGGGLVTWEPDHVYVTHDSHSVQRGVDAVPEAGTVSVEAGFDDEYDAGAKLLTVAYQDGPTLIAQGNAFDATKRELVVIGTDGRDKIDIKEGDIPGAIDVTIKEKRYGRFKAKDEHGPTIDRIMVYGLGGDDDIKIHKSVGAIPAELYGGDGDDKLRGGEGDDYLSGGDGDDLLSGQGGRDVMVGGLGRDKIDGDDGGDILVGGVYLQSEDRTATHAIMSEWSRTDLDYAARVDHLLSGGGLNGGFLLNATTVFDDNANDKLRGGKGLDWCLADDDDKTDENLDELLTSIELDFVNND